MFDANHLHAMIVHFPIALVIIGFLSDAVGLVAKRKFFVSAGLYLIVLGTIGTLAAYLSGNLAGDGIEGAGALGKALETHEDAAVLAVWVMGILAVARVALAVTKRMTGWTQWVMVVLLALGVGTIVRTGYYGGQLVYRHAAGVQLTFGGASAGDAGGTDQFQSTSPTEDND